MATFIVCLWIAYVALETAKGQTLCGDHLLPSIPDNHITASSSLHPAGGKAYTGPERGRLNTKQTTSNNGTVLMGAWAPSSDNKGQYIQANFDDLTYVESIVTQGQDPSGGFVKLYKMEYTEDGKTWKSLDLASTPGVEEIFKGNSDTNTPVESELDCPLFAKGIRIYPLEWDTHIALRFDVKGCYVDNTAVAYTTPPTPVTTPTAAQTQPTTSIATTTTVRTTPLTTPLRTASPFLPGILTPFGIPSSSPVTTIKSATTGVTSSPPTTVNLLTLIHWFMTALSNNPTPTTTPLTTLPSTSLTSTRQTSPRQTSTRQPMSTTPLTTTAKPTTIILPFMPGIQNPFGTTKRP